MFYLTTHSTHFIYGYMASDIWYKTTQIAREETRCRHMGYSLRLTARVLLYAQSNRHTTAFGTPVVEHWLKREPWTESLVMPEAMPASGRVRNFESMWTRKYDFPFHSNTFHILVQCKRLAQTRKNIFGRIHSTLTSFYYYYYF